MYSDLITFIRDWYRTDGFIPLHEPRFKEADRRYALDAIDSTFVSSVGEYVNRFERELASYLKVKYAVVTVNGTSALQAALRLAGVQSGDAVITQPLTFIATANAIAYNKAIPVFVDVDKTTLGLDPDALEQFLKERAVKKGGKSILKETGQRIAAVVPMHTFGHPCRMDEIDEVCDAWHLPVVEDAAEAIGSKKQDRFCGTMGLLGILSFNGNKTITCGGGGAILTNDDRLAKRAKHLTTTAKIDHPWEFIHDEIGYNFRMPNLNAALACAQLEHVDSIIEDKRKLAQAYEAFFKSAHWAEFVVEPDGCRSNYWLNAVMTSGKKQRDEILKITNKAGIMTRPAWKLLSDLPMYSTCVKGNLAVAHQLAETVINLPSSARIDV